MAGDPWTNGGNGWTGRLPVLLAALLFLGFLSFLPAIATGGAATLVWPWVPSLGIDLAFRIDGLGLTFALLISGIGTAVLLYANSYLAGDPQYGRFVLFLTAFMLAMLGLVLADDLILLFVFWELTTLTSYLLIGYSHTAAKSRRNALQALFVTGAGALAFLAGLILLGTAAGTNRISEINFAETPLLDHPLYLPIFILVLLGAITKSAQVPFHFWLPNAMAAPTPVSAFLHSATMVKAGVYLLARLHPALSGSDAWLWSLSILGGLTAVWASVLALRQTDLKQALAYTTLMALGTLTLLLAFEGGYAMTAFATFLVVHSLYKATLFLVVGNIDTATGTRETDRLGGLLRVMPASALAAGLAALSMAGLPPFLGFIAKELSYAGSVELTAPVAQWLVAGASLAANALMLAVAGIVAYRPFWRGRTETDHSPREVPWPMLAGPLVLASLGLLFGLFPGVVQSTLITPTVLSLTGSVEDARELKLWAGVNLPLVLSLATFAVGFVLYAVHRSLRATMVEVEPAVPDMDRGYDRFMDGLKGFATLVATRVQTGRMTDYMAATFATVAVAIAATAALRGLPGLDAALQPVNAAHLGLALLLLAGAAQTAFTKSRIAAVAALGVVGIGTALIFIYFGAPDVAITQLLVEVLIVVLVAVVMLQLPRLESVSNAFRPGHAALAAAVGAMVSLVLLAVLTAPLDRSLSDYFEATSYPEAFGRNIVNVILVDFRALDTFGEVAVVVIAALSAIALLRLPRRATATAAPADAQSAEATPTEGPRP